MRIVIDMQGAQTESRFRGIGRYTLSFTQAIVRNRGEHEVLLALSGLFPDTIEPIRAAFEGLLPQENIRVWYAPGPVREIEPNNVWKHEVAEFVREAFLISLKPDLVHISSFFEGYWTDAVTSIGRFEQAPPVSVTLYDLIPLMNPGDYLRPNPSYEQHYLRKFEQFKKASIFLTISESSRQEGLAYLNVHPDKLYNISSAVEAQFRPVLVDDETVGKLYKKHNLSHPFILCAGAADDRKNLPSLMKAFAALPKSLRETHQLLLVGKIAQGQLDQLKCQAESFGLRQGELCFTGYISDEELVQLYNLCKLYVFPSWHEGFGLPALEAMTCGAAVIAANTSSLPEVIGLDAALFDPFDVASISAKLGQALQDDAFRSALQSHGLHQAKQFSWDTSARRAIAAFESIAQSKSPQINFTSSQSESHKPRLAFVSPLPPARTGIADYSAELLPELAKYYELNLVVVQDAIDIKDFSDYGVVRDVSWLRANAGNIDRVIYQVGNSSFHQHMLLLIQEIPGVLVLHDFYLSGLFFGIERNTSRCAWSEALYISHGYSALRERLLSSDEWGVILKYPVNLEFLQCALGVVVHSEHSRKLSHEWYGARAGEGWEVIPLVRSVRRVLDKKQARKALDIKEDDFVVCSFGFLAETKLNHRLLGAWLKSTLAVDERCRLIFVGENAVGDYGRGLLEAIQASGVADRIGITGFASPELYHNYLSAADVAVQLRTRSRGETSAAVLDCMSYGLPLIVNAHGSIAEVNADAVWMLPDEFSDSGLIEAMEILWLDQNRRHALGEYAHEVVVNFHAPAVCAQHYYRAIERFYKCPNNVTPSIIKAIAALGSRQSDFAYRDLANCLSSTVPLMKSAKRLFLDMSATCRTDLKTGIERVARALLIALLNIPPEGYRIEPVYLSDAGGEWKYRYARRYTLELLGCPADILEDDIVEPECGDILLGLDLSGDLLIQAGLAGLFADYRDRGVKIYATIFDLLPMQMPEVFPPGADQTYARWLRVVSTFDGAICISRTVADDLAVWLANNIEREGLRPYHVTWFHLGADVANSAPVFGFPHNAEWMLKKLSSRPSFLMVGTVEPRKGYLQTIKAFSELWERGEEVNLVIVGREGWRGLPSEMRRNIPETIDCLRSHPELSEHLFWLEGISDEYLEEVYAASSCLIAASEGEGFGLPLIEAAQHKLPIIARDIPVFREVAGEHAYYFKGSNADDLAVAVRNWLQLYQENRHPISDCMPWLAWRESAEQLKCALLTSHSTPKRTGESAQSV